MADRVTLIRTGRKTDLGPMNNRYDVTERAVWRQDDAGVSLATYGLEGLWLLETVSEPFQDPGNDADYYAAPFYAGATAYDAPHLEV